MISGFINFEETTKTIVDERGILTIVQNLSFNNKYVVGLVESHSVPLSIEKQMSNNEIRNRSEEEGAKNHIKTSTTRI
ncbi:hypothetical protein TNIN_41431 [Trichonephila inaurata madagascariensis]|uniref:Uncharacterized protein n=1 Tax=Trichonephila inaurata madagascariensis TaxID=2747483 RepID=A0A8X6YFJ7_9ARAC|nr:hypothetical protein TNIN_41431 [Trichonephila inaurata madagascariensis]